MLRRKRNRRLRINVIGNESHQEQTRITSNAPGDHDLFGKNDLDNMKPSPMHHRGPHKNSDSYQHQSIYDDADHESIMHEEHEDVDPVRNGAGGTWSPCKRNENSPNNNSPHSRADSPVSNEKDFDEDASVVNIELIYCQHCKKSYAPATYKKFCQSLDENGVPKCMAKNKKRRVYNSAKVRITSNTHLNSDEQRQVISSRKKVVADLRNKATGRKTTKTRSKLWRQQSDEFRKAMETNRLISKAEKEGRPAHYYL